MNPGIFCIVLTLFLYPAIVHGTSTLYMCEKGIVSTGDNKGMVCGKCGNPTNIDNWTEKTETEISRNPLVIHTVIFHRERWTYDLGRGRLIHVLEFSNGILKNVDTVGHGSDSPVTRMNICEQEP